MDESILVEIKKMLGLDADYTAFDTDILVAINGAFLGLMQCGLAVDPSFSVTGIDDKWSDFLPNDNAYLAVKNYIYLSTKILFDPPSSSFVLEAYNKQLEELRWRIGIQADPLYF